MYLCNCGTSDAFGVFAGQSHSGGTYTTNFPLAENPISEGGRWINGDVTGLDWSNVRTNAGLAYGTQGGNGNYDDSVALFTWPVGTRSECASHGSQH